MVRVVIKYIGDGKPTNNHNQEIGDLERSFFRKMKFELEERVNQFLRPLINDLKNKDIKLIIPVNGSSDFSRIRFYRLEGVDDDLEYKIMSILGYPE